MKTYNILGWAGLLLGLLCMAIIIPSNTNGKELTDFELLSTIGTDCDDCNGVRDHNDCNPSDLDECKAAHDCTHGTGGECDPPDCSFPLDGNRGWRYSGDTYHTCTSDPCDNWGTCQITDSNMWCKTQYNCTQGDKLAKKKKSGDTCVDNDDYDCRECSWESNVPESADYKVDRACS